jgi:hypothetical protein
VTPHAAIGPAIASSNDKDAIARRGASGRGGVDERAGQGGRSEEDGTLGYIMSIKTAWEDWVPPTLNLLPVWFVEVLWSIRRGSDQAGR